jgi:hypothetical protein
VKISWSSSIAVLAVTVVPLHGQGRSAEAPVRVLAALQATTLERELNQAAETGQRDTANPTRSEYRVLQTSRTSTMQREVNDRSMLQREIVTRGRCAW